MVEYIVHLTIQEARRYLGVQSQPALCRKIQISHVYIGRPCSKQNKPKKQERISPKDIKLHRRKSVSRIVNA